MRENDPASSAIFSSDRSGEPLGPPDIPGYRLGDILGRGGMGCVYAARQVDPERDVAIKVLRSEIGSDASRRRFLREIGLLARIRHHSVVRILDAGATEQGNPYYIMERVEGRSWADAVRACPSDRERLTLFLQLCDGVAFLHREGILHRDLKPGNLLVDGDGRVRILDFGLARTVAASQLDVTRAGQPLGTLQYMSPEQWRNSSRVDGRTDVYSLGVILYELLGGEIGDELISSSELWLEDRSLHFRAARELTIDPQLCAVLEKALELDPDARLASLEALALDLRRYLTDRPVLARRTPMLRRAQLFARRNASSLGHIALIVTVLAGCFIAAQVQRERAVRSREHTESRVELATRVCADFLAEAEALGVDSPEWSRTVTQLVQMLDAIPVDRDEPAELTRLREHARELLARR